MKWQFCIAIACSLTLAIGCGGQPPTADQLGQNSQELAVAPTSVLSLDLPGCEDTRPQLFQALSPRWRLALHPFDAELAVLSRDDSPVCISSTATGIELLHNLLTFSAPNPAIRENSNLSGETEGEDNRQGLGNESTSTGQLGLPIHRLSSVDVQDDPIPVPRTLKLTPKNGS